FEAISLGYFSLGQQRKGTRSFRTESAAGNAQPLFESAKKARSLRNRTAQSSARSFASRL
ncbi:hypothetical protein, partial [Dyella monticola]|uniref:hypothetical protein n=1 Tax=Dyella monticola TaxID=1927958 RepID=UPI001E362894